MFTFSLEANVAKSTLKEKKAPLCSCLIEQWYFLFLKNAWVIAEKCKCLIVYSERKKLKSLGIWEGRYKSHHQFSIQDGTYQVILPSLPK